jgi:hypothetical protein
MPATTARDGVLRVSAIDEAVEQLAWRAVGAVHEQPRGILTLSTRGDPKAPGRDVVLGRARLQPHARNLERSLAVVLLEGERLLPEIGVTGPASHLPHLLHGSGRQDHPQLAAGLVAPWVYVPQRHEVEEVVGMHVADHHRVELIGMAEAEQLSDDPGACVEEQPCSAGVEQVAGAGLVGIGTGRRTAEHGEAHRSGVPSGGRDESRVAHDGRHAQRCSMAV